MNGPNGERPRVENIPPGKKEAKDGGRKGLEGGVTVGPVDEDEVGTFEVVGVDDVTAEELSKPLNDNR